MKRSFMTMIMEHLRNRLQYLVNEKVELERDKKPYAAAMETGRLAEIELLTEQCETFFGSSYNSLRQTDVQFNNLAQALHDLPDDAPLKFIIQAGLGAKVPMASITLTMSDLRRMAAIQRLYENDMNEAGN